MTRKKLPVDHSRLTWKEILEIKQYFTDQFKSLAKFVFSDYNMPKTVIAAGDVKVSKNSLTFQGIHSLGHIKVHLRSNFDELNRYLLSQQYFSFLGLIKNTVFTLPLLFYEWSRTYGKHANVTEDMLVLES